MPSFVPPNERIPGVYQSVELQRQAGLVPLVSSVLLIGYRNTDATDELDGVIQPVDNRNQVQADYGAGCMLDLMACGAIASGKLALRDQERGSVPQLYTLGLAAPTGDGTAAATYPITITGTAASNGTMRLVIGPESFTVPTLKGETQDAIAARATDLISRKAPEMAFTASVDANVVTLTARHTGTWANDLTLWAETRAAPGVTVAIAPGVAGEGNLDLAPALDAAYAIDFDAIVVPQDDVATQSLLRQHVIDGWDYTRERYQIVVAAQGGDIVAAQTAARALDDFRVILVHGERTPSVRESARSLPCQIAAAAAGRLWSQRRPNWNFNLAAIGAYGRPRSIDRGALSDTIAAGVCEIVEPESGNAPGAFVDPVTTAVTDQTGHTDAPDTTWQPVEYPKTAAYVLRQVRIELARFAQLDSDEDTRIAAIAAARTVLQLAADQRIIRPPDDDSVTASYEFVGGRTDLVLVLSYQIIVGVDVIAVRHRVRSAGAQ